MKLVIFDADGTLTPLRGSSLGPFNPVLMPNVAVKCAALLAAGATLGVASNQSSRRPKSEIISQMRWTQRQIGAATIRWSQGKRCKPSPAMLNEIMRQFNAVPTDTIFIGDWDTDRQAAEAAGVAFAFAKDFFKWED